MYSFIIYIFKCIKVVKYCMEISKWISFIQQHFERIYEV